MQQWKRIMTISRTTLAIVAAMGVLGCSKSDSETAPPPTSPQPPSSPQLPIKPVTQQQPKPPKIAGQPNTGTKLIPPHPPTGSPPVVTDFSTLTPQQQVEHLTKLEHSYRATPELTTKIQILYDLSGTGVPAAVDSITRLFQTESDAEMKGQMIDALDDIDGENDRKLTMLTGAIAPNQPQDVRETAINALSDLEDGRAIAILQGLLNDPSEDIREAAQDAIDWLKESANNATK